LTLATEVLAVDRKRVVHETVDDETIIIDVEEGSYYSLTGAGPEIWALILAGGSETEIFDELERRYPGSQASAAVRKLVERLLVEGLAVCVAGDPTSRPDLGVVPANGEFVTPELTKFTDLQNLLLLDPVHEIDEAGWPHAPQP
jgi:hypothetical protein